MAASSPSELLRIQSERVLDVVDWLDALSTPEEIEAKFAAAKAELNAGEVIPMADLRSLFRSRSPSPKTQRRAFECGMQRCGSASGKR
jgi:hypothetical protein